MQRNQESSNNSTAQVAADRELTQAMIRSVLAGSPSRPTHSSRGYLLSRGQRLEVDTSTADLQAVRRPNTPLANTRMSHRTRPEQRGRPSGHIYVPPGPPRDIPIPRPSINPICQRGTFSFDHPRTAFDFETARGQPDSMNQPSNFNLDTTMALTGTMHQPSTSSIYKQSRFSIFGAPTSPPHVMDPYTFSNLDIAIVSLWLEQWTHAGQLGGVIGSPSFLSSPPAQHPTPYGMPPQNHNGRRPLGTHESAAQTGPPTRPHLPGPFRPDFPGPR